jgi:hypothetical protein
MSYNLITANKPNTYPFFFTSFDFLIFDFRLVHDVT